MRLHFLAAATALTFALAGCVSSGGLHPDGTPTDPASLKADRSVAAQLAAWYAQKDSKEGAGTKWLPDLRQWWRRGGRELSLPVDGVSGATRPAGQYQLKFVDGQAPLGTLAPGDYTLVVEAAREVGGREVVRVPFTWPVSATQHLSAQGRSELGAVSLDLNP